MDNIIEIESGIDAYRKQLPDSGSLLEAKILIVKAQNIMQKHIERNFIPSAWRHQNIIRDSIMDNPERQFVYES